MNFFSYICILPRHFFSDRGLSREWCDKFFRANQHRLSTSRAPPLCLGTSRGIQPWRSSKNFEDKAPDRESCTRPIPSRSTTSIRSAPPPHRQPWPCLAGTPRRAALANCALFALSDHLHRCFALLLQRGGSTQQRLPPPTPRLPRLSTKLAS